MKDSMPDGRLIRRPELVLIDLDGTLVDSVPDLAWCVDEMMRRLDMPERGEPAVRNWIGNGVERLVRRALVNAYEGEPDDALFEKAFPVFMALYQENVCVHSSVFPGIREGIAWLESEGIKLGVVTNKAASFTEPLLEKLGLRGHFGIVVSGDTLEHKKPHPAPLLHAADHYSVEPAACLMVGDSMHDVDAARAAGFQVACVTYGYNHGMDIREAGADAVINSLEQIQTLIEATD